MEIIARRGPTLVFLLSLLLLALPIVNKPIPIGNAYLTWLTLSTSAIASRGYQNTFGGGDHDADMVKFPRQLGISNGGAVFLLMGYDGSEEPGTPTNNDLPPTPVPD